MANPNGDPPFQPTAMFQVLHRLEVRYVLIGALAATIHGSPVRTNDADICPQRTTRNLTKLATALDEMDARLRTPTDPAGVAFQRDSLTLEAVESWTLITRFGALDIAFNPSGTRGYEDLIRDAKVVDVDGTPVPVASLLDIIRSKEATGRDKDRSVLPMLREMLDRFGENP